MRTDSATHISDNIMQGPWRAGSMVILTAATKPSSMGGDGKHHAYPSAGAFNYP